MVVSALILPLAFVIGVQGHLTGLAMSWLIGIPLILALTLPRTCAALGLQLREVYVAVRAPLIAGIAMYTAVLATRFMLADWEEASRLPVLIVVGGASYLLVVQLVDRTIWAEARRLATALKG